MLVIPVLLYSPSQYECSFSASPLRLTVMLQQGDSSWLVQVRLASSSYFSLMQNFQPAWGGLVGSTPTGAFRRASFFSSPTTHSLPNLKGRRMVDGAFLTCTSRNQCPLGSLLIAPVCKLESPPFLRLAQDQTFQRLDPRGSCWNPHLTASFL